MVEPATQVDASAGDASSRRASIAPSPAGASPGAGDGSPMPSSCRHPASATSMPTAARTIRAYHARVNRRFQSIAPDVVLGEGATVHEFVNLYGCKVGAFSRVGAF